MTPSEKQSCFRDVLERSRARWTGIARSYSHAPEFDDLLQEVLLQVWKSLETFDGRSSIDTWAYRIALNTALAWDRTRRNRAKNLKTSAVDVAEVAREVQGDSHEMRILNEFLTSLSKTDRAVMLLFMDNVPTLEAAEILGLTEGALRVRMHRIRKSFEDAYCDRRDDHEI